MWAGGGKHEDLAELCGLSHWLNAFSCLQRAARTRGRQGGRLSAGAVMRSFQLCGRWPEERGGGRQLRPCGPQSQLPATARNRRDPFIYTCRYLEPLSYLYSLRPNRVLSQSSLESLPSNTQIKRICPGVRSFPAMLAVRSLSRAIKRGHIPVMRPSAMQIRQPTLLCQEFYAFLRPRRPDEIWTDGRQQKESSSPKSCDDKNAF